MGRRTKRHPSRFAARFERLQSSATTNGAAAPQGPAPRNETLGTAAEVWNRRRAEDELAATMAAVRGGTWQPRQGDQGPESVRDAERTFHEFASEWLDGRRDELRPRTIADDEWALSYHLPPFFAEHSLAAITLPGSTAAKLREGRLGAAQINKTLKVLATILDVAIEYELVDRANPASGRRRRVKAPKPQRTWVEPEQLLALIEAADTYHRPILATLAGAGLRVGEALALHWREVNLATGTLVVGTAKTDAGTGREVDLPAGLIEALGEWKARSPRAKPDDPVFVARPRNGRRPRRQTVTKVDHRIKTAIKAANRRLAEAGIEPISERVRPHSLRRTYSSLRAAAGDDPVYIAEQLGHTDPGFTFRVYQRAAKRRDRLSGAYLEAFDRALEWALIGTGHGESVLAASARTTTGGGGTRRVKR